MRRAAPPEAQAWFAREHAFEERSADPIDWFHPEKLPPYQRIWVKTNGSLPDDPRLHILAKHRMEGRRAVRSRCVGRNAHRGVQVHREQGHGLRRWR